MPHADHIHGIDDLRGYVLEHGQLIDIHADDATQKRLTASFGYCFETPAGSNYPPTSRAHRIDHREPIVIEGEGGALTLEPLPQIHGEIVSLGFRIGSLAYCPDVSSFPEATVATAARTSTCWSSTRCSTTRIRAICRSTRRCDWIARLAPKRAVLTHMHIPLDYETVMRETPDNIVPAFDGMTIEMPYESD